MRHAQAGACRTALALPPTAARHPGHTLRPLAPQRVSRLSLRYVGRPGLLAARRPQRHPRRALRVTQAAKGKGSLRATPRRWLHQRRGTLDVAGVRLPSSDRCEEMKVSAAVFAPARASCAFGRRAEGRESSKFREIGRAGSDIGGTASGKGDSRIAPLARLHPRLDEGQAEGAASRHHF